MSRYPFLLDRVNESKTAFELLENLAYLEGYRACLDDLGIGWSGTDDDYYTLSKYPDADMTCGVLHDKPNLESDYLR